MAAQQNLRIGQLVKAARSRAGLTQEELADRAGIHPDSLSIIERGRSMPSTSTLKHLSTALGIPVQEFFQEPSSEASGSRMRLEAEINEIMRALPDKLLEVARDQLKALAKLE